MKYITKYIVILIVLISATNCIAQDTIKKKNGEVLKVVVKEINESQVKYYHFDDPNQVLFTVDRAIITDIKFAYGKKYVEEEPIMTDDYFNEDQDMAIKLSMSSLLWDAAILSFGKAIDAKSGYQISAKLFGIGFGPSSNSDDVSGFGLELGYRLKFGGLRKKKWQYRPNHLLEGGYMMPIVGFNHRSRTYYQINENSNLLHFGINFGKQKVIQNTIVIDYYAGFAYYGGSNERTLNGVDDIYSSNEIFAGDVFGGNNFGVTLGFKVGLAFGKYGEQKSKRR